MTGVTTQSEAAPAFLHNVGENNFVGVFCVI